MKTTLTIAVLVALTALVGTQTARANGKSGGHVGKSGPSGHTAAKHSGKNRSNAGQNGHTGGSANKSASGHKSPAGHLNVRIGAGVNRGGVVGGSIRLGAGGVAVGQVGLPGVVRRIVEPLVLGDDD
jgi:hypothetical protein